MVGHCDDEVRSSGTGSAPLHTTPAPLHTTTPAAPKAPGEGIRPSAINAGVVARRSEAASGATVSISGREGFLEPFFMTRLTNNVIIGIQLIASIHFHSHF